MNEEQVKSSLRTLIATFGGIVAGWFAAKGWFTIDQVTSVLNSPVFLSLAASIVMGAWGLITHTKTNAVNVVNNMPEVKGVVTNSTAAGVELAKAIPGPTVAVAGTTDAKAIATQGAAS